MLIKIDYRETDLFSECEKILALAEYKNIKIENGIDNTGNLYNHLNLLYCKKK